MIIFLYGQDTYRMREKIKEIIARYKKVHQSGLNLKYLDFLDKETNTSFSDFKDNVRQVSIFKEKKLLVIFNSFSNPGFKQEFMKQSRHFVDSDDIIVFVEEKPDKRESFFKFLEKNAKSQEFKPLSGQKLKNWIIKEFERYGKKIDSLALDKLINYVGNDLWRLSNEVKKLSTWVNGVRPRPDPGLTPKDIKGLVRANIETDIFKTIDAIADKNKKQALDLLHKHLEKGDSPLYLLAMISYQFKNLLIIKDLIEKHLPYNSILNKSGLHPFVARKSHFQCQKFSFEELKKIYQKIFQVDLKIKTGQINPEIGLDILVMEI